MSKATVIVQTQEGEVEFPVEIESPYFRITQGSTLVLTKDPPELFKVLETKVFTRRHYLSFEFFRTLPGLGKVIVHRHDNASFVVPTKPDIWFTDKQSADAFGGEVARSFLRVLQARIREYPKSILERVLEGDPND
jgi:hypothetical protein